jgi:hypothetical protein
MRQLRDEAVGMEATKLVTGERQEAYGDPVENYERQAAFISAIVGVEVSRRQAIHIMIALKMCRDLTNPLRDNEVDICGYATILQMDREDQEDQGESHDEHLKAHKAFEGLSTRERYSLPPEAD